jgi:hypothetical protein
MVQVEERSRLLIYFLKFFGVRNDTEKDYTVRPALLELTSLNVDESSWLLLGFCR